MAHRKWWPGRVFSVGYRGAACPTIDTPTVGITTEVTDGPQAGRKIDVHLTPAQAREFAGWLLQAAEQVDAEVTKCAITRDAAAYAAERSAR